MLVVLLWLAVVRAAPDPCANLPRTRTVEVAAAGDLHAALGAALPGDLIRLRPGIYEGRFTAAVTGSDARPIVVCGPRDAVLDGGGVTAGYGLHVTGSHWIFAGFTVARAKKGIVLDGASHNQLRGLEVKEIGNEGVHFRGFSSDNVLATSSIHDTGKDGDPHFGEGVYIGSAANHWCEQSRCGPDRSDRNLILDNTIGPRTTAEPIDVKEGTSGGVIRGNALFGVGMVKEGGADSWVDVKGNGYVIEGNRGFIAPRDGFQVYVKAPGWGRDNQFRGNVAEVRGPGYGFRIEGGGDGNVIGCDNAAVGARRGLANVPCHAPGATE